MASNVPGKAVRAFVGLHAMLQTLPATWLQNPTPRIYHLILSSRIWTHRLYVGHGAQVAANFSGKAVGAFVSAHPHRPVGAHGHHGAVEGVAYWPVWSVEVHPLPACTATLATFLVLGLPYQQVFLVSFTRLSGPKVTLVGELAAQEPSERSENFHEGQRTRPSRCCGRRGSLACLGSGGARAACLHPKQRSLWSGSETRQHQRPVRGLGAFRKVHAPDQILCTAQQKCYQLWPRVLWAWLGHWPLTKLAHLLPALKTSGTASL